MFTISSSRWFAVILIIDKTGTVLGVFRYIVLFGICMDRSTCSKSISRLIIDKTGTVLAQNLFLALYKVILSRETRSMPMILTLVVASSAWERNVWGSMSTFIRSMRSSMACLGNLYLEINSGSDI